LSEATDRVVGLDQCVEAASQLAFGYALDTFGYDARRDRKPCDNGNPECEVKYILNDTERVEEIERERCER
jgi:hypothetical protein